jgi:hypothetical protein
MKLYEPITILLAVLLIGYAVSDKLSAKQDRKELKQQIDNSVELSQQLATISSEKVLLANELNTTIKDKLLVEERYTKQLQEKDNKVGEQFGLLTSQAQTIAQSTPANDTITHYETSKSFMELHNGRMTDPNLAWNTAFINTQMVEYELLKQQLEQTKKENEKLNITLVKESEKNVELSDKLNNKSIDLEKTVGKVQLIENTLFAQRGWVARIKQLIFVSVIIFIICGVSYVLFHIWQIVSYKKKLNEEITRRRLANTDKYDAEFKAKELTAAVKTFLSVNEEGNETMKSIINANGLKKIFDNNENK